MAPESLKSKVCLVGDSAVGKTSLIRRFVLNAYDESYVMTLGTRVSKKTLELDLPLRGQQVSMDMLIWDIMGQKGFRELMKDAYFYGVRGILAVADVTRRTTLNSLDDWIDGIETIAGEVPVFVVANKADLADQSEVDDREIAETADAYGAGFLRTSAKSGENVEEAFRRLAEKVAGHQIDTGQAGES